MNKFLRHVRNNPLEPVFARMVSVMNIHREKGPYVLSSCAQ